MKKQKLLALIVGLAMIFALLVSCGDSETSSSESASASSAESTSASAESSESSEPETSKENEELEPIKIGHIVDLTGSQANTGEEAERSLQFAIDTIGTFGGHPVEIVVGDGQDDASTAADVARKMVEVDGVVAIFGPTQPDQKTAVANYCQEVGIPLIFYNSSPEDLLEECDWVVGAGGGVAQLPSAMADYSYNVLGYRKVHILTMETTSFKMFSDEYIATFTELGGEIASEQYAPFANPDWSLYLSNMAAQDDADAIVAWASGSYAIALWTAWYEAGLADWLPMIALHHGGFTDYFVPAALAQSIPAAAEAMIGTVEPMLYCYNIDTPENKEFVELWKDEFGTYPQTNLPGSCYQAALLFEAALESTGGSTDPDELLEALLSADVVGPEGHLYFDNTNAATKDVYICEVVQLEDGSYNNSIVDVYENVPPEGLTK